MYRGKAWLLVIVIVWEGMGESSIGQEKGMDAGKQITNKYKPMLLVNNRNQIKNNTDSNYPNSCIWND